MTSSRPHGGFDIRLLASVLGLVLVGLAANYSTSITEGRLEYTYFYRQLLWAGVGFLSMIIVAAIPTRYLQFFSYFVYVLGIIALLAVFAVGQKQMGARRWIDLGVFQLQPSEFTKITTLLGLARLIADYPRDASKIGLTLIAAAVALFPMGLIFIEPDLGTSLVYPMLLFCMLAWGGAPVWHLLLMITPVLAVVTSWHVTLFVLAAIVLLLLIYWSSRKLFPVLLALVAFVMIGQATPMLWNKLHPYQQKRLLTFINPEADPLGSAYQIIQSKIAVGSGGITGKGFLSGTQTQLKFLPEGHTDFIFSAWGEQFGFLGTGIVTLLFFTIFYRGIRLAARAHNPFNSLVAAGVVSLLTLQALLNLLMTVGFLPVTGVPLPFISYGGSSLLTWMTLAGLLMGVSIRWREY